MEESMRIAEDEIKEELDEGRLKDQHLPFPPVFFEPFIPIKPHCCYWFLFDTSTMLRNVIIVCDRVSAYVQKHEPTIDKDLIVSEWRQKKDQHKAISDSSLAWGYVVTRHAHPNAA